MFTTSTETKPIGKIAVIYGEGGIGKSSIIGSAIKDAGDNGLLVSVGEDGITPLKNNSVHVDLSGVNHLDGVISKWATTPKQSAKKDGEKVNGLMELMFWLAKQSYTDVAFDSLSMIMEALEEYCFQVYYLDDPTSHGQAGGSREQLWAKANGFGKSELIGYMSKEWKRFLAGIQYLRSKNINVYISSHTATKKGRLITEDLEFDYAALNMPSNKNYDLSTDLFNCSDIFLYGKTDTIVAKGKNGKGRGLGGEGRVLVSKSDAVIKAKARVNMPDEIEASWTELKKYI